MLFLTIHAPGWRSFKKDYLMLTNGFSTEELDSCGPGATLKCTESVVMHETSEVTFSAGQTYTVDSISDTIMVLKNDHGRSHMLDGYYFRRHFTLVTASASRPVVHLSETGIHARRRFCGAALDDGNRSVHGVYAPLHVPEFRQKVCEACMMIWATEAYADGDEMPDYVAEARLKYKESQAGAPGCANSASQLALGMQ